MSGPLGSVRQRLGNRVRRSAEHDALLAGMSRSLDALRDDLVSLTGVVAGLQQEMRQINHVVQGLNHDVRTGAPEGLPLFVGYVERLRTDTESAVAASTLIARQLRRLEQLLPGDPPRGQASG